MFTIGIVANVERPHTSEAVLRIIEWLKSHDTDCFLDNQLSELIRNECRFLPREKLNENCDFIVALGGDGTMLATARAVGSSGVPILGINLGSLGFLTHQPERALIHSLERLIAGDFQIEKRMVLHIITEPPVDSNEIFALNDVVIDRGAVSRLITINVHTADDYVSSYRADGLIISTPTGSTAYNLAAGGPIVYPTMNAIIICPICPHTLTQRPLILSKSSVLEMSVESGHGAVSLTIDGQLAYSLETGHKVIVKTADHHVNLVRFSDSSFFDVLRQKLHLGRWPKIGM